MFLCSCYRVLGGLSPWKHWICMKHSFSTSSRNLYTMLVNEKCTYIALFLEHSPVLTVRKCLVTCPPVIWCLWRMRLRIQCRFTNGFWACGSVPHYNSIAVEFELGFMRCKMPLTSFKGVFKTKANPWFEPQCWHFSQAFLYLKSKLYLTVIP